MRLARATAAALALSALITVAGCGSDSTEGQPGAISVWIPEEVPERVSAMQAIFSDFTAATGTEVELTAVAEDELMQLLTSAVSAGGLPDVLGGIPLSMVRAVSTNQLIDTDAVAEVLAELDEVTFSPSAVRLTRDGDDQLAVPSESWSQLLLYRKDLFEAANLPAPTTYEAISDAARQLHSDEAAGFVGATAPGDAFTEQTFEHIALGNHCQLVDDAGQVQLDSAACVESFGFYGDLIGTYSVPGTQTVETTRAAYLSGKAAMVIWSSFILDELAGLWNDVMPTCPQCIDDPAFLARNSGVVTAISGPSGSKPALFGEITSWTIATGADVAAAQQFIRFMMNDGYVPYLKIAPEGKVPVRAGTPRNDTQYADSWGTLEVGVDTRAPLLEFYSEDVLQALTSTTDQMSRWAIPQGQGALLGATQGEMPVATAVNEVANGTSAEEASGGAAEAVREIQESIR